MSLGRLELEHQPGSYVSGTRARWLLQARRARLTDRGQLRMLEGRVHAGPGNGDREEETGERVRWSAYSSAGVRNRSGHRWLDGFHMSGDAINHGGSR